MKILDEKWVKNKSIDQPLPEDLESTDLINFRYKPRFAGSCYQCGTQLEKEEDLLLITFTRGFFSPNICAAFCPKCATRRKLQ